MQQRDFLTALENEINRQIDYVIRHIQNMREELLFKKFRKNSWSISQTLAHVNEFMQYYVPVLQNKIVQSEIFLKENTIMISGKEALSMILSVHPLNEKMNKSIRIFYPRDPDAAFQVLYAFMNLEEHLLLLIRKAHCIDLNNQCHPFPGRASVAMNLGELFVLIAMHNARHLLQVEFYRKRLLGDKHSAYTFGAENDFVFCT